MALHHCNRLEWQEPSPEDAEKLRAIFRCYETSDEAGMLAWARREPDLFRVLLGPEFGPQVTERGTERQETQSHNTAGTFAMFAANRDYYEVVEALLEAGLGPEDRDVFIDRALIEHPRWRFDPKRLATALSHCSDATTTLLALVSSREWLSREDRRPCDLLLLAIGSGSLPEAVEEAIRKRLWDPPTAREQAWATEVVMRVRIKQQQAAEPPTAKLALPAPERRRKCV